MARIDSLGHFLTDVADAIRSKTGSSDTIQASDFDTEIENIPSGGGAVEENDVNFYDYDGTLLYSYTKAQFLALTEMPANPTHTRFTAQGWNWSFADAQDYVNEYGALDIGQTYTTASGLNEFDIELTPVTGLEFTLQMNGTKNWGDGTSDTLTTHTYQDYGEYTITCDGTSMTTTSQVRGLFGQTSDSYNYANYTVKGAYFSTITSYSQNSLAYCWSLKNVILINDLTDWGNSLFYYDYCLEALVMPKAETKYELGNYSFIRCYNLKNIIVSNSINNLRNNISECNIKKFCIPEGITRLSNNTFTSLQNIEKIIFPKTITTIAGSCFQYIWNMFVYDFSHLTTVPTLGTNCFHYGQLTKLAKIIVPDSLYNDWIVAENWSTFANYIIKKSDWDASQNE